MAEIVKIEKKHLPRIAELEKICFSEPWSVKSLEILTGEGAVGFAVTDGEKLCAYGGMVTVLDEGQITNIAADPSCRRCGYAGEVLKSLCSYASEHGICSISLEVRASNEPAVALYEKFGFETLGVRRGFYRKPTEDAKIMVLTLKK